MLLVSDRPSVTIWVLRCIRKRLTDELHERDQKEETDEKDHHDMVHHIIFKNDESIVYGLFDALVMRRESHGKVYGLTLTVLSKKFSECLALTVPLTMLSRVDTMLEYVSWTLDPYGSTS